MKKEDHIATYGLKAYNKMLAQSRTWTKTHPEKRKAASKNWADRNLDKIGGYYKAYCKRNPEKVLMSNRAWRKTIAGKEFFKKRNAERYRNLGYMPLNALFEGSEGHHMTHNSVVYIPAWRHKSIWHNLTSSQGMQMMNKLAVRFLLEGF